MRDVVVASLEGWIDPARRLTMQIWPARRGIGWASSQTNWSPAVQRQRLLHFRGQHTGLAWPTPGKYHLGHAISWRQHQFSWTCASDRDTFKIHVERISWVNCTSWPVRPSKFPVQSHIWSALVKLPCHCYIYVSVVQALKSCRWTLDSSVWGLWK